MPIVGEFLEFLEIFENFLKIFRKFWKSTLFLTFFLIFRVMLTYAENPSAKTSKKPKRTSDTARKQTASSDF